MDDMIKKGVHGCTKEENYVEPKDPLIRERLEWFRDQKLALMMHFAPYTQMGSCSWPLCDGEASWSRSFVDWESDAEVFKKQYVDLNKSFNPFRIQPDEWADFAAENGFKYLIFTTKHHDGFCMYDSKYTDYKITSPDCPFHTHKYADIVRAVFDAFRKKGIAIGAYFSKSDWNCPWYWAEGMDQPVASTPCPTYNTAEHPEIWEKFKEFTHNQILELVEGYGKIDILWLDGGQVKPSRGQDIQLSELVAKARAIQPWLITADRTVGGENENYITPEQSIPEDVIRVPWESCMTIGRSWPFQYSDTYKSARTLVRILIQVVSRGGNLALNVGPQPDGRLPKEALQELSKLGSWLKVNGDAIYGTRAMDVPQIGNVMYTKKGETVYAIIPLTEGESLEARVLIPVDRQITKVTCLGYDEMCAFQQVENGVLVELPKEAIGTSPYAISFKLA